MKLDSKQARLILIGGLGFSAVVFFAITFLGLSVLSSKSRSLVDLKAQSQTASDQLVNLVQSKKDVEKYSYFKTIAKTVIPNDKNQAAAVVEINQMANASGISIQSITFPASTLGPGLSTSTTGPSAAASSTPSVLTQAKPVAGIPGLYSLELTITPDSGKDVASSQQVTYPKMLDFLKRIESNRHTAQISQVSIQPAGDGQSLSFTLVINIFIKP